MMVNHREYISDIIPENTTTDGAFQLLIQQKINPGNTFLFPWLSAIANRFESYRFRSLRFVYEPQCPTTAAGTISMVVDFDSADLPPTSKLQMMSYKGAVRSPPWFCSNYQCDPSDLNKQKSYYVSSGNAVGGTDSRLYDVGTFFAAFEGSVASGFYAGELYVEYLVELMTPDLSPSALSGSASAFSIGTNITGAVTVSNVRAVGPVKVTLEYVASPEAVLATVAQPGYYQVVFADVMFAGTTVASEAVQITIPAGSTATVNATEFRSLGVAGTIVTPVTEMCTAFVKILNPNDYFQITKIAGTFSGKTFSTFSVILTPMDEDTFSGTNSVIKPPVPGLPVSTTLSRITRALEKLQLLNEQEEEKRRRAVPTGGADQNETGYQTDRAVRRSVSVRANSGSRTPLTSLYGDD